MLGAHQATMLGGSAKAPALETKSIFLFDDTLTDALGFRNGASIDALYSTVSKNGKALTAGSINTTAPRGMSINNADRAVVKFDGTESFTVEFFTYTSTSLQRRIFDFNGGNGCVNWLYSGGYKLYCVTKKGTGQTAISGVFSQVLNLYTYYHFALVFDAALDTHACYVNGVRFGYATAAPTMWLDSAASEGNLLRFGNNGTHMDYLRITPLALYTGATLTIPTLPYPLA